MALGRCRRVAWVGLLLVLTGCAAHHEALRPAAVTRHEQLQAGLSDEENRILKDICPYGRPVPNGALPLGPTRLIVREGYVLEHSTLDRIPLWVCEHLRAEHLAGPADRQYSKFARDPLFIKGEGADLKDYSWSGYDRGHMAPSEDYTYSQDQMNESFYLSNMTPQTGNGFNRHIWADLESHIRRKGAEAHGAAYVITGSLFYDPEEENAETADGIIRCRTIGKNNVAVPTHLYKIVLMDPDPDDGSSEDLEAVALVLENKRHTQKIPRDIADFVRPIDWIEERCGLDFLPALDTDDPATEERLERREGDPRRVFEP